MGCMSSALPENPPAPRPASLAELGAVSCAIDAASGPSALALQPFLLVNASPAKLSVEERLRLACWLRQLPCPVIGIAPPIGADPLVADCDVLVSSVDAAQVLVDNIRRSPVAAAVLVQLLRATEKLPLAEALIAESLAYSTLQAGPDFHRWLATHRAAPPSAPDAGPAVLMERDGERLALVLNRPSTHNAMTVEMRDALVQALQLAVADESIASLQIRANGKAFSTGGDLDEFGTAPDPATAHIVRSLALPGRLLAACAHRAEVRVHGACIGSGLEFPAFARRISAAQDAFFQLPELRMGLIPGAGGCVSVARRIGRQRLAWMVLSGKRINAQRALEWGLVEAVED